MNHSHHHRRKRMGCVHLHLILVLVRGGRGGVSVPKYGRPTAPLEAIEVDYVN